MSQVPVDAVPFVCLGLREQLGEIQRPIYCFLLLKLNWNTICNQFRGYCFPFVSALPCMLFCFPCLAAYVWVSCFLRICVGTAGGAVMSYRRVSQGEPGNGYKRRKT